MILLIDNYDSFVYNLARYLGELGFERLVKRNDAITLNEIKKINPSHIIISPGPCTPLQAGISLEVIEAFSSEIPILGICLGHQAIGQVFGGRVVKAKKPMHGKAALITHNGRGILKGIKTPLRVGRYHSLVVERRDLPEVLQIVAESEEGEIMGLRHRHYSVYGLQFHPESILTQEGYRILNNFLKLKNEK